MSDCKTCNGRGKVQGGYAGETLEDCPDCGKNSPEKRAKRLAKSESNERKNCEECGWPQDACCCKPPAKTVKPYCGECGGAHEPSGARSDCVLYWKRRAVHAENEANMLKNYNDSYWKKIAIGRGEKIAEMQSVILKAINLLQP